jgi:AraC family transcriptional regulator
MTVSPTRLSSAPPARSVRPLVAAVGLRASLVRDGPGLVEAPAQAGPRIVIHVGRPVWMRCTHGEERHTGLALHGDIDIVPGGAPSSWELREPDRALVLSLPGPMAGVESRFRLRDPQIEHLGWALLAEAEAGGPSGALFVESLAAALTARLRRGCGGGAPSPAARAGLPARTLRRVTEYVEENLAERLTLAQTAALAGLSVSHFKAGFRRAAGMPFHQYVLRRRIDRAAALLREGGTSISQAAQATGFCHASHLAARMRRLLGVRPRQLARGGG